MSGKIRILILDNTFTFGGAINSLYHLLKALDKEKFEPILVTGQPPEFLKEKFKGITWYHVIPKLSWVNNRKYRALARLPIFKLQPMLRLLNLCRYLYWLIFIYFPEALRYYRLGKRHGIDVVHLNNILGSQLPGIIAARLLGVPCLAHLRDFEDVHFTTRFYARFIDHHIAISQAIKENLLQLDVEQEKITVVHDALDLTEFNADINFDYLAHEFGGGAGKVRYGIFGRVIDWKGIKEFIEAARIIADQVPEAQAFIIGGPSDGEDDYYL